MRYIHANGTGPGIGMVNSNPQTYAFCEQVHMLTSTFENWNDCEKTVVLYALLKRLPYPNLKFLQFAIEYNLQLAQNFNSSQTKLNLIEDNANSASFLNKLVQKYTSITIQHKTSSKCSNNDSSSTGNDSGLANSMSDSANKSLESEIDLLNKYSTKEDIIQDLLLYLPLMKPGNDDVKKIYIQLIPIIVEDSIRQIIAVELVQQALSYLLIHPAINNDDRKNLSQWLRHLEDHIAFSYMNQSKGVSPNYSSLPQDNASSFVSNASSTSSSSSSSSSASSTSSSTWQTVQPPPQGIKPIPPIPPIPPLQPIPPIPHSTNSLGSRGNSNPNLWDHQSIQINQEYCDDLNQTRFPKAIGNKNSSQSSLNSSKNNTHSNSSSIIFENDDHHVSFSKNGTEVIDYDTEEFIDLNCTTNDLSTAGKSSSGPKKITKNYLDTSHNVSAMMTDYLHVPNVFNDHLFDSMGGYDSLSDDCNAIKTRRSNSLTTPTASGQLCSSSAENLLNLQQKPRSFSLSMESSRNTLTSSGSETRLDDFNKLNALKFNTLSRHVGMSNIGVWLKSLRLHKYFWLFTDVSYEQMLEMSEEYLENLGVTKGARHKLVLCIQKLSERQKTMLQIEKELLDGTRSLKAGLDELTLIVMSPMKPINSVAKEDDVALHFIKVLDCAFQVLLSLKYLTQQDEEAVNVFLWIIDKALHNDAFLQQVNHLKEYKFKLSKVKMTFAPKTHYNKNQTNCNTKMRWNPNGMKTHKTGNNQNINSSNSNISCSSSDNTSKSHRKTGGSMQVFQMYNNYNNNKNTNSKSSSYPNFSTTTNQRHLSGSQRSSSRDKLHLLIQQQQQQQQQHPQQQHQQLQPRKITQMNPNATPYHCHSMNNLMPPPSLLSHSHHPPQLTKTGGGSLGGSLKSLSSGSSTGSSTGADITSTSYTSGLIGNNHSSSNNNNNNNSNNNNNNNNQISNKLLVMSDHNHVMNMKNNLNGSSGGPVVAGSIGDINSRLESLCLQMTEQAIN